MAVLLGTGCAQTWTSGRDVSRVAALRKAADAKSTVTSAQLAPPPKLKCKSYVLPKARRGDMAAEVQQAFASALSSTLPTSSDSAFQARVQACRMKVSIGKKNTLYEAKCRVQLLQNDVVVVEVDARGYRSATSKALPKGATLTDDGQNPFVDEAHLLAVLQQAVNTGAAMLLDREQRPPPLDDTKQVLSPSAERALALQLLQSDDAITRAGALADLARVGQADDAEAIVAFVDDAHPLVRKAALFALSEMAVPSTHATLAARCSWGDDVQQRVCRRGVARMQAQDDSLPDDVAAVAEPTTSTSGGSKPGGAASGGAATLERSGHFDVEQAPPSTSTPRPARRIIGVPEAADDEDEPQSPATDTSGTGNTTGK